MMQIQIAHISFFLLLSVSVNLNGQSMISQTENPSRPDELIEIFNSFLPDNHTGKIWGRRYFNPYFNLTEHQFFKTRIPVRGVLYTMYDTINCGKVLYDLYRDKIIVFEPTISVYAENTGGIFIEIEEELIRRFKLFEPEGDSIYDFINAESLDSMAGVRESAFFQIIFEGERLDIFKKHQKILTERIDGDRSIIRFKKTEELILRKDSDYQNIKRNKDLLKMYPGAENEIKVFLRSSHISCKSATHDQIQLLGRFLDELEVQSIIPYLSE